MAHWGTITSLRSGYDIGNSAFLLPSSARHDANCRCVTESEAEGGGYA